MHFEERGDELHVFVRFAPSQMEPDDWEMRERADSGIVGILKYCDQILH